MTGECTDNKEYLASLYVQSALEKNNGKTPLVQAFISVNSIQSIYGQEMHYNTIYIYLYFTIIYIKNYY